MFVISTRNFPPDVGGMQNLIGGLVKALVNHGPVTVFADKTESFKSSAVLAYLVERFLTRNPPEEEPELDFIELITIKIGITIATANVSAFNKKIKYSNKISIIYIKRLTTVPVKQEASVAAKSALNAIFNNVPLMSGQIAERPPRRIPTLDIFAKPQIP